MFHCWVDSFLDLWTFKLELYFYWFLEKMKNFRYSTFRRQKRGLVQRFFKKAWSFQKLQIFMYLNQPSLSGRIDHPAKLIFEVPGARTICMNIEEAFTKRFGRMLKSRNNIFCDIWHSFILFYYWCISRCWTCGQQAHQIAIQKYS